MHRNIRQENPGRCPLCGMELVLEETLSPSTTSSGGVGIGKANFKNYLPLIIIIGLIATVSAITSWDYPKTLFVEYFMIGFFIVFGGFKLFDIKAFAEGYSTYDLIAQRIFAYGYIYPFIELGFGFAMLLGYISPSLLWAEIIIMTISGIGVSIKILRREKVQCLCLGTILKVPLTYVTLIEDFGMAILALYLLLK